MSQTIQWIPIEEKLPPAEYVLASTKSTVYILRYHPGRANVKNTARWLDQLGQNSQLVQTFRDVIAWAELPAPFGKTQG